MDSIIPATIVSVGSLVNNVLSSVKAAKELTKQSTDSALKEQIAVIFDDILDLKERVLNLDEENRSLKAQLAERTRVKRTPDFGYFFADGGLGKKVSRAADFF